VVGLGLPLLMMDDEPGTEMEAETETDKLRYLKMMMPMMMMMPVRMEDELSLQRKEDAGSVFERILPMMAGALKMMVPDEVVLS